MKFLGELAYVPVKSLRNKLLVVEKLGTIITHMAESLKKLALCGFLRKLKNELIPTLLSTESYGQRRYGFVIWQ